MKVLLLGYGKMGKSIESILKDRGHETIAVDSDEERTGINASEIDVAIEFSTPETAYNNIKYALENGIPVLSGTTGWLEKKPEIDNFCREKSGAFFYASNFSPGVNIFFQLNKKFARVMNKFSEYNVSMKEIHHTQKLDSPSGTAITLAELISGEISRITGWKEDTDDPGLIDIHSERIGDTPGTHSILYKGDDDSIELIHTAFSRKGFANGAVMVAEWLVDRKGVLSMDDFLGDLMN